MVSTSVADPSTTTVSLSELDLRLPSDFNTAQIDRLLASVGEAKAAAAAARISSMNNTNNRLDQPTQAETSTSAAEAFLHEQLRKMDVLDHELMGDGYFDNDNDRSYDVDYADEPLYDVNTGAPRTVASDKTLTGGRTSVADDFDTHVSSHC